jgi:hypothetical protein
VWRGKPRGKYRCQLTWAPLLPQPGVVWGRGRSRPHPQRRHRVLLAANPAILSMLEESTNDGPVSTALPPPMSLPLVRLSHSDSTAR